MAGSAWTNQLINLLILAAQQTGFSGFFAYSPAPGAGNLFISIAAAAGTDPFGDAYVAGLTVGKLSDDAQVAIIPSTAHGDAQIRFLIPALSLSNIPNLAGGSVSGIFADLLVSGPAMTGPGINDWVQIVEYSNDTAGTLARGELRYIDTSGAAHVLLDWGKSDQAIHIPAGGGPFISQETFHTIGLPSSGGFTGAIRVKKLPWNMVALDFGLQWTNTTGGTFTCGSLPDSTYYPTVATPRRFALGTGGTPSGDAQAGLIVPASGALTVFVNASVGGNTSEFSGGTYTYPTN